MDLSPTALQLAERTLRELGLEFDLVLGDGTDLAGTDLAGAGRFDLVICVGVLAYQTLQGAWDMLTGILGTRSRYLLVTTHHLTVNSDIFLAAGGHYRPLDISLPPFSEAFSPGVLEGAQRFETATFRNPLHEALRISGWAPGTVGWLGLESDAQELLLIDLEERGEHNDDDDDGDDEEEEEEEDDEDEDDGDDDDDQDDEEDDEDEDDGVMM